MSADPTRDRRAAVLTARLAAVLTARLAAVLTARLAAVLTARLAAGPVRYEQVDRARVLVELDRKEG